LRTCINVNVRVPPAAKRSVVVSNTAVSSTTFG